MVVQTQLVQVIQQSWFPPLVYSLSIFLILSFGVIATILSLRDLSATKNIENFTQAQGTAGLHRLVWGYYGAHVGAWVLFSPPQFAGFLGGGFLACGSLFFYTTLAPVIVALGGLLIKRVSASTMSFPQFCRQRYGQVTFILILLIMTFNMCVGLLAEYTAIGQLFKYFVDPQASVARPDVLIVVVTAIVVALYTAVGGLKISLITDQFQGILSIVLTLIVLIYIAAKFRYPLDRQKLQDLNLGKGSFVGASSWGSQVAYVFQSFYSEDLWQRNYAAKNLRVQMLGAAIGGLIAGSLTFFFAIIGTLVAWAGLNSFDMEGNLTFFQIFQNNESSWAAVLVVLIAVSMNCSLVDSYQNALISCLSQIYIAIKEELEKRQQKKLNSQNQDTSVTSKKRDETGPQNQQMPKQDLQSKADDNTTNYNNQKNGPVVDIADKHDVRQEQEQGAQHHLSNKENLQLVYQGFINTLWLRIIVILLQIILIPLSLKGYNISSLNFVVLIITCFLFVPNFLGLLINPKYYSGIQQALVICLAVVAPHIYSYILLKRQKGPFKFSHRNVMRYVWLGQYNGYDYALFVSIIIVGLCCSTIFISINIVVRAAQGQLKLKNFWREIFFYKLE